MIKPIKYITALVFILVTARVQEGYADSYRSEPIEHLQTEIIDNKNNEPSTTSKSFSVTFGKLDFRIEGQGLQNTAEIRFQEGAKYSIDSYDAYYLKPFNSNYVGLFSIVDTTKVQINSLPYNLEKKTEIPLDVVTTASGDYKLHWSTPTSIPESWSVKIIDNINDTKFNLTVADSIEITVAANAKLVTQSERFTIVIEGTTVTSQIAGAEGWRLLSSPVETKFDSLIGDVWTQGYLGSDSPASGSSNVFTYDETIPGSLNNGFTSLSDQSDTLRRSQGYAMYVYADDNVETAGVQGGFPKIITHKGFIPTSDVEDVFLSYTGDAGEEDNGWNLIGNPFGRRMQVKDMGFANETDLNNSVYVYQNGAYKALNANGVSNTDTVGVGEGFFVKVDNPVTYTYPIASTSMKKSDVYFRSIDFELKGQGLHNSAKVRFYENAKYTLDADDAYYLDSYNADYLGLFFSQDETALQVNSFPYYPEKAIEIPLHVEASETGMYTLSWDEDINIPSSWSIKLLDNKTGSQFNVMKADSLQFKIEGKAKSRQPIKDQVLSAPFPKLKKAANTERFTVLIVPNTTVSMEEETNEVATFSLEQNYPNPFNPTTSITYSVAKTGPVKVTVYNVMGQQVATLVNATKVIGSYQIEWNATSQASGIYYYRLTTPEQVITRQMTLIK